MTREEAITEIKSLINDVIDYNEKNGTCIFVSYSPHVDMVSINIYNEDKMWHEDGENDDFEGARLRYDFNIDSADEFVRALDKVRSWIKD